MSTYHVWGIVLSIKSSISLELTILKGINNPILQIKRQSFKTNCRGARCMGHIFQFQVQTKAINGTHRHLIRAVGITLCFFSGYCDTELEVKKLVLNPNGLFLGALSSLQMIAVSRRYHVAQRLANYTPTTITFSNHYICAADNNDNRDWHLLGPFFRYWVLCEVLYAVLFFLWELMIIGMKQFTFLEERKQLFLRLN